MVGPHRTQLIYPSAAGLCPHLDGAYGWIVFLDAPVVVDASTVVVQFVADGIDPDGVLFVNDILFEGMLCITQIRQYSVDLCEK